MSDKDVSESSSCQPPSTPIAAAGMIILLCPNEK